MTDDEKADCFAQLEGAVCNCTVVARCLLNNYGNMDPAEYTTIFDSFSRMAHNHIMAKLQELFDN